MIPNPTPTSNDPNSEAFVAALMDGIASADAGRAVSDEDVRKWLLSWGTENELPEPECR